jgi:hypothetical protein
MVAHREQAALAERLIAETLAKQGIPADQLTLHADRGSSMTSKPVAFLLADLGVTKTHSRPHVSTNAQAMSMFPPWKKSIVCRNARNLHAWCRSEHSCLPTGDVRRSRW